MEISQWLENAVKKLSAGSGTARLDAEVILSSALEVDRSWLHSHSEQPIPENILNIINKQLKRRLTHEPLAYILEKTEFYGRDFYITNGVLVPRPESETMIDLCKQYCAKLVNKNTAVLVDVGTGSGALAITAALETETNDVVAIDIDDKCIEVADKNTKIYNLNIKLIKGDLIKPLKELDLADKSLILLANLPYVPDKYAINNEAQNEPSHAIFGGQDGLSLYNKLFQQLTDIKFSQLILFTESLPPQHDGLRALAQNYNLKEIAEDDFIQVFSA